MSREGNTAKKEFKIPPLSLSNALSTAEKNAGVKLGQKVASLIHNRESQNISGTLHDVSYSRL